MQINRYGFLYSLFSFGKFPPFFPAQKDRRKRTSLSEYVRVMTMGAIYHAYLAVLTIVPAAILTLAANIITIPFGFGLAVLFPYKKFIAQPFEFLWRENRYSWSRVLVPFWILVGNLGLVLTNNPIKKFDLVVVLLMNAVAAGGYMLVIAASRSQRMRLVEFVDLKESP